MSSEVGVGRGLAPYEELRGFAGMATPELDQFGDAQAAHTRRFTPRRNRWADVQAFDARVVELEARATDQVQYRDALIGARLEPLKRIFGLTSQIKCNQVIAGLRADLDFARDAASPAQRRELAGASGRDPRGAVWKDTPEGEAQIRAEHQAAVDSVRNRPGSEWVA